MEKKHTSSCISHLTCSKCAKTYSYNKPANLCQCGGPLLVSYDLEKAKNEMSKEKIKKRVTNMWRYSELLPIVHAENIISLGEGYTPLIEAEKLGKKMGIKLLIKDEGLNPTGSFKARGAATGVSKAKELGIKTIAMPTAGNAGGAWASYCAKAGIEIVVAMPEDATEITKKECVSAGAKTYLVKGLINDAGKIISQGAKKYGWFEVATLKEPYRIEGKKTMGFEIAEQLNWKMPDVILYPTGGGVGVIAIWKAVQELRALGWLRGKDPKLVAVQSEGCKPIVEAFHNGRQYSEYYEDAKTIVGGLRVPKALGDFLVLEACRKSGGTSIAVTDEEIIASMKLLAKNEGMLICPEGASTLAALEKLKERGFIREKETVCLLNTGSGLKYADLLEANLPFLSVDEEI